MASAEHQLISLIIRSGSLKEVLAWGITGDDFLMGETRAAWDLLMGIYTAPDTAGAVLGISLAQEPQYLPTWQYEVDPGATFGLLCTEIRRKRLTKEIQIAANAAQDMALIDPIAAYQGLQNAMVKFRRIDAGKNTDVSMYTGFQQVVHKYQRAKDGGILGKFPWPWEPMQAASGGVAADEFGVFYGRPKSMKSWVLLYLLAQAYLNGQKVLFYTKEMTAEQCYQRIAAIIVGVAYQDLRHGRLTEQSEALLYEQMEAARIMEAENRMMCITAKDVNGRDTPTWLRGKIDKYKPDVAYLDALYLMSVENQRKGMQDNERVRELSRDIRRITLEDGVPILATMQANRKAAGHEQGNLDEIAFSDALSQDCTLAARVIANKDSPTISIIFAGSREWALEGLRINAMPASNFSCISTLSSKEIEEARSKDTPEGDAAAATPKKKGSSKKDPRPATEDPSYKQHLSGVFEDE